MAYSATVLDEFRLNYDRQNLDYYTNRLSTYGAYATYVKDTPNLLPGAQELVNERRLASRTVSVPIIKKTTPTTNSSRSCNAKTNQGTSAYVTPSWTTVETGFMMVPSEHEGNNISYQNAFDKLMLQAQSAFLLDADTDAVTDIIASLNAYIGAEDNPFAVTANYLQVPLAYHDTFFDEFGAILLTDDLPSDNVNIIGSPRVKPLVSYYQNQGSGNSANTAYQFGPYSFAYTNRVTVSTAYLGTAYGAPVGSLGYLSWVDPDARRGHMSTDGKQWSTVELPLLGQTVGMLFQSTCGDKSSLFTGGEATLVESFSFSFDRAFVTAADAIATPNAGVIYGIEFLKT
jgi:hypothetical protein